MSIFQLTHYRAAEQASFRELEREAFYEAADRAGLARTAGEAEEVAYRAALLRQIGRPDELERAIYG